MSQKTEYESKSRASKSGSYGKRKYFVCLDTNIVISLAGLHNKDENEIQTLHLNRKYDSIKRLKSAIEKRQITAIITPYVLQELFLCMSSWGPDLINYLKKSNILVLDIPDSKLEKYYEEIEIVAAAYSTKLNRYKIIDIAHAQGHKPSEYPAYIFKAKTDKETGQKILKNDARIMAEAAKLGLVLVTNNTIDFIHNHRQDLIGRVNRKLCLATKAVPYTSDDIIKMYNKNYYFPTAKASLGNIVSAKNITTEPQIEK